MRDEYEVLRKKCKILIDNNLQTDNFLNIKAFRDFHRDMLRIKGLKFYRYYSPTEFSFNSLKYDTLGCRNPKYFNDIYEGMISSKDGYSPSIVKPIIEKACDSVSIVCFSEVWDNLLMYAHYADSFRGFCVEYNLEFMAKYVPLTYLFPVLYQNRPSKLARITELSEQVDRVSNALTNGKLNLLKIDDLVSYFIHKSDIWEYEKEWRFIIPLSQFWNYFQYKGANNNDNNGFHDIKNFDCISAVYLGANASEDTKNTIKEIILDKNDKRNRSMRPAILVFETHIKDSSYSLERDQIL